MTERIQTVSIIVPTLNEELNLPDCLASISPYFAHVFVVDSLSSDRTLEIARAHGAHVAQNPFEGYAKQYNWARDNLPLETDWIAYFAADERLTPALRKELAQTTRPGGTEHAGFFIPQRYVFMDRLLEHGGWAPSYQLRMFRRSLGRWEERAVHEIPIVEGTLGYLENHYIHHDARDIAHFVRKHNRYSTLEAEEAVAELLASGAGRKLFEGSLWGDAMERRRWIKTRLWPRLPARFVIKFVHQYIVKRGFLDGRQGYYFALLHAFYEMLIAAKTHELLMARQQDKS